ncbi:MAG: HD domain-containing protein [Ferrovum sp.]|nr:HD domain-containing protein [Ferrovum sp.]
MRVSEARYRRLFETAQDGILLLNAETAQIEDANPFLITMLGYSHTELMGKKIWEIGAFKDTALSQQTFMELQELHYIRYDDLPLVSKDGTYFFVEFVSNAYDCEGIQVIQCNIRDNTSRHTAEIALIAATRALKMLSESTTALLRSETEITLLLEYCRIAVETGGYLMAWIGVAEDDDKSVKSLAKYGWDDGYLALAEITRAESDRGNDPTGNALRSKQVHYVGEIATDPRMAPWRHEALLRGYQSTIAIPFLIQDGKMACLTLYHSKTWIWSATELKLLREIGDDLAFGIEALQTAVAKIHYQVSLRESLEQTIQVIADTGEERDAYTAGHQRRVAHLCTQIANELGYSADFIHGLHLAASIHDLGKIGIPVEILTKPRRLTTLEFGMIKEHPNIAFNILKNVSFPWPIAKIIVQHHERIDGSGYPMGLKGDEILKESKILAVADVVEAMASYRPYRPALGIEAALSEIVAQRGITLDAEAVDACLEVFNQQNYRFPVQ